MTSSDRIDARVAGRRERAPGSLAGAGRVDVGDGELIPVDMAQTRSPTSWCGTE